MTVIIVLVVVIIAFLAATLFLLHRLIRGRDPANVSIQSNTLKVTIPTGLTKSAPASFRPAPTPSTPADGCEIG